MRDKCTDDVAVVMTMANGMARRGILRADQRIETVEPHDRDLDEEWRWLWIRDAVRVDKPHGIY